MKVGNRSKVGNREQRMQARFEKLVAKVNELELENKSLRSQKQEFDWARAQAHFARIRKQNKELKQWILENGGGDGISNSGHFTRILTDDGAINLLK